MTQFVRSGSGPYTCPDSYPSHPHDLIRDPRHPNSRLWVCPIVLGAEQEYMDRLRRVAEEAEARKAKAEEIAAAEHDALILALENAGVQITTDLDSATRRALTAAALAGLEAQR